MEPRDRKVLANHQGSLSKVREEGLHLLAGGRGSLALSTSSVLSWPGRKSTEPLVANENS